eukprot:CAMPEP_0198108318 /NCGR_PEP_ID=MMETSP1442-20131203/336_1 /TAXON_ID= /ORGANISM="Craspedostauros australis, Strain CCMP3328" /LENGTH=197 /DNA_ID=CAMNT_0043763547 /DNA_START=36 /DNA_END=629 /DNA_ORIENTATION=+
MKVALLASLIASAAAFSQESRREALSGIVAAGAAFVPVAANAAAGESPRFSVFGLIGDGTSYSEGAAYGSDQSSKVYSPYSVYGEAGKDSLYQPGAGADVDRKKAILAESRVRLEKLPAYIEKKKWFEVTDELSRYMYETRFAVRGLAKTVQQKEAADDFFQAIEAVGGAARYKKQDAAFAAAAKSVQTLDAFLGKL